jgi:hypothetical protein
MIQSATANFLLNARRATSDDALRMPDRQRGMWSFLTWSFFLAQAIAAHEAYAKGVMAGEGDAEGGGGDRDDAGGTAGANPAGALGVNGFDIDPAAAAQMAAAVAAGLLSPDVLKAMQADPAQFQAFLDGLTGAGGAGGGDIIAADDGSESGEEVPGSGPVMPDPDTQPSLPGIVLPIDVVIDLGLEVGGSPLLDLGVQLDGDLGLHVALGVAPIDLALDASLDGGLNLQLGLLGMTVAVGGDGGLGGLLALNGGLGGLSLASAVETLQTATGLPTDMLDPVLASVASGAHTVIGTAESIAAPAITLVSDVLDGGAADGVLASAGSILHAVGSAPVSGDFFGHAGQHTSYAIELQQTTTFGAGGGELGSTAAGAMDDLAIVMDHVADDAATTLSNLTDALNLRGVGDGFA